jgi:hypothetical protein
VRLIFEINVFTSLHLFTARLAIQRRLTFTVGTFSTAARKASSS